MILAGYTDEMKAFIDSNPGLQSRFNRYIEFPDYSAQELASIFLQKANECQYTCDGDKTVPHFFGSRTASSRTRTGASNSILPPRKSDSSTSSATRPVTHAN